MSYKYLFFDADGTLFDFDTSERYSLNLAIKKICGRSDPSFIEIYKKINKVVWEEFEEKKISMEELTSKIFDTFKEETGLEYENAAMAETYLSALSKSPDMMPGALEILEKTYKNHTLILATNGISYVQRGRVKAAGIEKYFSEILISEEIGIQKPEKEFFEAGFKKLGDPPLSQILMIGDSFSSDIRGARNAGISCCLYSPGGKTDKGIPEPDFIISSWDELEKKVDI